MFPFRTHATDVQWMAMLAQSKDEWLVITGDRRIHRNRAERDAFRAAMLRGFALAPGFSRTPLNHTAALLVWRWPELENLIRSVSGTAMFELPINRSTRPKQLPL